MSNIGRKIYGHCDGFLGRDFYALDTPATIEGEGYDWIVVRDDEGLIFLAWFEDRFASRKEELIEKWSNHRDE